MAPLDSEGLGRDVIMGLRFYSRLPTGGSPHQTPNFARIALALPFTSLLIGIVPSLLLLAGSALGLPDLYVAFLAIGSAVLVSGAMTEDALGDSADGLAGGQTPQKRLEIFKDSRLGTYGVTAIIIFMGLRVATLSALLAHGALPAITVWLAAIIVARSSALWLTLALPTARADGASASSGPVSKTSFLIGAGFAALLALILAAPFTGIFGLVLCFAVIAATAWAWSRMCLNLVGGQTGDLIGGLQAALEIVALSTFIIFVGS